MKPPLVGRQIGPYRVDEELGSGAMGSVFRAQVTRDTPGLATGAFVALKVIHPHLLGHAGFFRRFLREAAVGKAVRHPNVVRIHDVDAVLVDDRQVTFLVMEYVAGQTLRAFRKENGPASDELCLHVGREVARGLAAIHASGALHRDLKPENVILAADHFVKVMDLGLAYLHQDSVRLSQSGLFLGTYLYAAPEQVERPGDVLDERADLYALGLLLHELSVGRPPRSGRTADELLEEVRTRNPSPLSLAVPHASPFLAAVVDRLLTRDPEQRFGSAAELVEILDAGERSTWWRQRDQADAPSGVRLPDPLTEASTPFFGRAPELKRLTEALREAVQGSGSTALVSGAAGIGKSRLVDAFLRAAATHEASFQVISGVAHPGGVEAGPGAFLSAFRDHFASDFGDLDRQLTDLLPMGGSARTTIAELLRGAPAAAWVGPDARDATWAAFGKLVAALGRRRPVVLIIEDLHFAPQRTQSLFASLARDLSAAPVLLIGTQRPSTTSTWTTEFERLPGFRHLRLAPLRQRDCAALVTARLATLPQADNAPQVSALAARVAERAAGNPYFALEIVRTIEDATRMAPNDADDAHVPSVDPASLPLPHSIRELLLSRLAELTTDERELLEVAATQGTSFEPTTAAEVLERPTIGVLRDLAELSRRRHLVRPDGRRYRFTPPHLAEVVREAVPELTREHYHGAIGASIARRLPVPPVPSKETVEACDHLLRGLRLDAAGPLLIPAVEHLEARLRERSALALIERALDRSPEPELTRELQQHRARIQARVQA